MFIDSWGNRHETEEKAHDAILEMLRADKYLYLSVLNDYFVMEIDIWDFICKYAWDDFSKVFAQEIHKAEEEWVENYMEELEEEEDGI